MTFAMFLAEKEGNIPKEYYHDSTLACIKINIEN